MLEAAACNSLGLPGYPKNATGPGSDEDQVFVTGEGIECCVDRVRDPVWGGFERLVPCERSRSRPGGLHLSRSRCPRLVQGHRSYTAVPQQDQNLSPRPKDLCGSGYALLLFTLARCRLLGSGRCRRLGPKPYPPGGSGSKSGRVGSSQRRLHQLHPPQPYRNPMNVLSQPEKGRASASMSEVRGASNFRWKDACSPTMLTTGLRARFALWRLANPLARPGPR